MKFFKRKPKLTTTLSDAKSAKPASGDASFCEIQLPEAVEKALEDTKKATDAKMSSDASPQDTSLAAAAAASAVPSDLPSVHLFPGFEAEAFDLAYGKTIEPSHGMTAETPVLMMRWKGDTTWFKVPPMFNTSIINKISERESEKDLNRLLRDTGYDVESIARK